jgi:hypothetical protein
MWGGVYGFFSTLILIVNLSYVGAFDYVSVHVDFIDTVDLSGWNNLERKHQTEA